MASKHHRACRRPSVPACDRDIFRDQTCVERLQALAEKQRSYSARLTRRVMIRKAATFVRSGGAVG